MQRRIDKGTTEKMRDDYDKLKTEGRNPKSANIDKVGTLEMLRIINGEDAGVAAAVGGTLNEIAAAVDIITDALRSGGHLIYIGAGTSGRLGVLDASECPPTFGVDRRLVRGIIAGGEDAMFRAAEGFEDSADAGRAAIDTDGVAAGDVVVGISASGGAPFVLGALERAREIGAVTIGVTCNPGSPTESLCRVTVAPYVGPEVISGSTRLKAGTATKMVLNMLSTGAMIKLGYVRGNLMINVRPTNAKLRGRAVGIIAELCGCDRERAADLLDRYGNIRDALEHLIE